MLDFGYYNMDCMEGMKEFPDGYFDIAIVDPPYGGVTKGGYMKNQMGGGVAKNRNDYHLSLWKCEKPGKEYFDELFRVSKNQIIWGGELLRKYVERQSVLDRVGQREAGGHWFCRCGTGLDFIQPCLKDFQIRMERNDSRRHEKQGTQDTPYAKAHSAL